MACGFVVWCFALVRQFDGEITSLFCIGELSKAGRADCGQPVYQHRTSHGYDGQFYHLIAHDPLLRGDTGRHLDEPRMRSRRVLVPALAHVLAGGDHAAVHWTYFLVLAAAAGAGAWFVSRYAALHGRSEWWGLLSALTPATAIGAERGTIDGALAALIAAAAWTIATRREHGLLAALTLAPLARETGLLLTAGMALESAWARDWRGAIRRGATVLPFLAWVAYVQTRVSSYSIAWFGWPFEGFARRWTTPFPYPFEAPVSFALGVLDIAALAGIALASWLALRGVWSGARDGLAIAAALFVLLGASLANPDIWAEVYAFGRTLTPLPLLLGFLWLRGGSAWLAAPLLLIAPRVLLQMGAQMLPAWVGQMLLSR